MSDNAIQECKDMLNSREFYIGVDGKITFNFGNDVIDLVLANITG